MQPLKDASNHYGELHLCQQKLIIINMMTISRINVIEIVALEGGNLHAIVRMRVQGNPQKYRMRTNKTNQDFLSLCDCRIKICFKPTFVEFLHFHAGPVMLCTICPSHYFPPRKGKKKKRKKKEREIGKEDSAKSRAQRAQEARTRT